MIQINREKLADFEKNIRREWVMTNGIGGYADAWKGIRSDLFVIRQIIKAAR